MRTTTIGLVMIVRDEEQNLPRCLESVRNQVDEIVIVDTGSSDRTIEVARRFTDKIYRFPWNDDFSAARNFAIEQASSEWLLSLDADEELDVTGGDLRELVAGNRGYEAYFLPLLHASADLPGNFNRYLVLRVFRNRKDYRFFGAIHEQLAVARPEAVEVSENPVIRHKVVAGRDRRRKCRRNLELLQREAAANPGNAFLQYYLGVEWLGLGKPARALPCFQRACRELDDSHLLFRAPAVRYLIGCLRALDRIDEALCFCLEECARYPDYTDLFFEGGLLLEARGDYAVAIRWFEEAVRSGRPPAVFAHTEGTSSDLAFYHLGYCCERLGRFAQSRDYYRKALSANPECVYPLYNLFLLELATNGPREACETFRSAGYLDRPAWTRVLVDLFCLAGFPDLAALCLREGRLGREPEDLARLARLKVYSRQPDEALAALGRLVRTGGMPEPEAELDEILAWTAKGDLDEARKKALALWRRSEGRGRVLAVLSIVARLSLTSRLVGLPEKHREPEAAKAALSVVERCLLSRGTHLGPKQAEMAQMYQKTLRAAMDYLIDLSPEACRELSTHLAARGDTVRQLRDFRFGMARRLCP
ncbi:MAG: glycosyltransferase [Bacillota bacterium]|nr:glycosyltransferase [Bacillota bacterium]